MINAPIDRTIRWQSRPLCSRYLWVQFEALHLQVQEAGAARDLVAHWALGVLADDEYEVLGVWLVPASGPMRWSEVFDDLQVRGVEEIRFVACNEPKLVRSAYPGAVALPSMGQLLRLSLDCIAPRDQASAAEPLRAIRGAGSAAAAHAALAGLTDGPLGARYPATVERWRDALALLGPLYALTPRLRRFVRLGDDAFWEFHLRVSRAIDKHGCFTDREAATSFVADSLSRAERLGQRRVDQGAHVAHRAIGANHRSSIGAARR